MVNNLQRSLFSRVKPGVCLYSLVLTWAFLTILYLVGDGYLNKTSAESNIQSWAIVIGVGEYEHLNVDTKYADDDARETGAYLEVLWGSDHVKALINSEVVKNGVVDAIYNWLIPNADEYDTVLFFIAGHGDCEYIKLFDSVEGSYDNDIHYSEFADWLDILESENVVVIMDTCGSGSFAEGLAEKGQVTITCGTKCQKCWQEDTYAHGVFSYYLLEALSDLYTVDVNRDGLVSAAELFDYISREVSYEFGLYPPPSSQHPQILGDSADALILFRITDAETIMAGSSETTSWWHEHYVGALASGGSAVVVVSISVLIMLQRRKQR